jgi:hypothetical protein
MARHPDAPTHNFNGYVWWSPTVEVVVSVFERLYESTLITRSRRRSADVHSDLVGLPYQSHVGGARDLDVFERHARLPKQLPPAGLHLLQQRLAREPVECIQTRRRGADKVER